MAKRKPMIVNGQLFRTKKGLREHIRALRDKYADNQPLDRDDFEFMLYLLNCHDTPENKICCGEMSMYVKRNAIFKRNREFWLTRFDGSETDFSFEACLKHRTKEQRFKAACRTAIASIVTNFKMEFFANHNGATLCPMTNEQMTLRHNSHVDHIPPETFDSIVQAFIIQYNLNVDKIELFTGTDGNIREEIVDESLEQMFIEFHNQRARLRVVSRYANLSLVKSNVQRK